MKAPILKQPRKIIQIAISSQPDMDNWMGYDNVVALCDDGSLWELAATFGKGFADSKWNRLPDISQE